MITKLNQIVIENDEFIIRTCLVNTDHIVYIMSGKLSKSGAHIIGQERERDLTRVILRDRESVFVDETVDELAKRFVK